MQLDRASVAELHRKSASIDPGATLRTVSEHSRRTSGKSPAKKRKVKSPLPSVLVAAPFVTHESI